MERESNKRNEAHIPFESDFESLKSNKYDLESNRYSLESEDKDVTSKVKEYLAAYFNYHDKGDLGFGTFSIGDERDPNAFNNNEEPHKENSWNSRTFNKHERTITLLFISEVWRAHLATTRSPLNELACPSNKMKSG